MPGHAPYNAQPVLQEISQTLYGAWPILHEFSCAMMNALMIIPPKKQIVKKED